jgi:hypothetical protein
MRLQLTRQVAVAAFCAATLLGGCAVHGQSMLPQASGGSAFAGEFQPGATRVEVRFALKIPAAPAGSHYVSPSTKSVVVKVFNARHKRLLLTAVRNLTARSKDCKSETGALKCRFSILEAPGRYAFDVTMFDRIRGKGNELAALLDFPFTVKEKSENIVHIAPSGLAASIAIAAPDVPEVTGTQGTGFTIFGVSPLAFTIAPMDADGNIIIGRGAPKVRLVTTPANMTVASPAPGSDTWTLTSTYTATDPGVASPATLSVTATPVPGSGGRVTDASAVLSLNRSWFYIGANQNPGGMFVFDDSGKPVAPSPGFASFGDVTGVAYDPADGLLFVTNYYSVHGFSRLGVAAPQTFAGSSNPFGIAYDPVQALLYVVNPTYGPTSSNVTEYTALGVRQSVSGFAGLGDSPSQISIDSAAGLLYIANFAGGIDVYTTSGATQSLGLGITGSADGVVYDPHNHLLYVSNSFGSGANAISVYTTAGVLQNVPGKWTGVGGQGELTFDPHTNLIYVPNFNTGKVTAYDEDGNQQPLTGFSGMPAGLGIGAMAIVP